MTATKIIPSDREYTCPICQEKFGLPIVGGYVEISSAAAVNVACPNGHALKITSEGKAVASQ